MQYIISGNKYMINLFQGKQSRGSDHWLTCDLDLGNPCSSSSPLFSECTFCPVVSQQEPFLRTQTWESKVLLGPSGQCVWLNPACIILMGGFRSLRAMWPPKTSLIIKPACLLKLSLTNLEWSASFFSLFLPSRYRGQFEISLGNILKFQTNKILSSINRHYFM